MKLHKDLRKPVRLACRAGWLLSNEGKHIKLRKGGVTLVFGSTLSDQRALNNILAHFKREGIL